MRIVKLHGSVDMIRLSDGSVEETSLYAEEGRTLRGQVIVEDVLIYPTQEKELFRFPFLDFFYELVQGLRSAAIWVFIGFSFTDLPILQLLESEARQDKKLVLVSPDADGLAKRELARVAEKQQICGVRAKVGDGDVLDRILAQKNE